MEVPSLTTLSKDAIVKMATRQDFQGTMKLLVEHSIRRRKLRPDDVIAFYEPENIDTWHAYARNELRYCVADLPKPLQQLMQELFDCGFVESFGQVFPLGSQLMDTAYDVPKEESDTYGHPDLITDRPIY